MELKRPGKRHNLYFDNGLYFIRDERNFIDSYSFDLSLAEILEVVDNDEFEEMAETVILDTIGHEV